MKVRSHRPCQSVARGIVVICAAVFVTDAHMAQAGINVWTGHGPDGGGVFTLAVDPITPNTLYAGTFGNGGGTGVFKSTDGGDTWSAANTGLPDNPYVKAFAIDPIISSTLYAGVETEVCGQGCSVLGGVYKSTDGATSWQAVNAGLPDGAAFRAALRDTAASPLY